MLKEQILKRLLATILKLPIEENSEYHAVSQEGALPRGGGNGGICKLENKRPSKREISK